MATSTYTTNLTDLYAGAGSTSNWTALGGGASGLNAETDYFIQGTGMTSKNAFASSKKGMIYNSGSDRAATIGTDGAVLMWTTHATPNSVANIASGGIDLIVGSGTGDYKHWYVGGGDTIEFMGWIIAAVNPSQSTSEADTGSPTATEQYFGALFDLPSGGPTKGAPNAIDAIRCGRCDLIYELGTGADPDATFQLAVDDKGDVTDRLGLIQKRSGAFFLSGLHQLGSSTNVVNFTDSNKTLFWNDHAKVTAPFNTLDIQNASSIIAMTDISWKALGTQSPGTWTTTDNATVTLTTCNFISWGTFGFLGNTTADTCTFLGCGQITSGGANMSGSSVLTPSVAADTGAIVFNEATDPDTKLEGMTFSKGSAAHHAIDFGTNVTSDITLRNCAFNGFGSTADANDSTVRFLASSGDITLNLVGCTVDGAAATTSNFSVDDAAGINVTVSISVPVKVTVVDKNNKPLESVQTSIHLSSDNSEIVNEDTHTVNDGSLVVGTRYKILTVGTSNFTTVGASSNSVGIVFTATGTSGGGNGTVTDGVADGTFGGATPASCYIRARKSSSGDTKYKSFSTTGTIASTTGLDATIVLQEDNIVT